LVCSGETEREWLAAPSEGVQVIVRFPRQTETGWTYTLDGETHIKVMDRDLWTGEDSYDPFGWGAKQGALLEDDAYYAIWNRACGDS